MIAVLAAIAVPLVFSLSAAAVVLYESEHPCSNPSCHNGAWWRVFVVVRASGGERPMVLARLATPFRVCGRCFADLDPQTAIPERALRKEVSRATLKAHGEVPDWKRTRLDREHVLAAWLRRGGR
jgi:hypothetical protein